MYPTFAEIDFSFSLFGNATVKFLCSHMFSIYSTLVAYHSLPLTGFQLILYVKDCEFLIFNFLIELTDILMQFLVSVFLCLQLINQQLLLFDLLQFFLHKHSINALLLLKLCFYFIELLNPLKTAATEL
jgi:hypothetical protein